jgi:hypothetical protein
MPSPPHFSAIPNLANYITTFSTTMTFPEALETATEDYKGDIEAFASFVATSADSGDLLRKIRETVMAADSRMSMLKLFRRCVSPVCDTEMTKKIKKISTQEIIQGFGHTFKPIVVLKAQFKLPLSDHSVAALSALLAENDNRGQSGYALTAAFFDWFTAQIHLSPLEALGPRGAGRDIELNTLLPDFPHGYPCDLVIRAKSDGSIKAVGFARYDSTRGGSQSDDRTGGNANKVDKAREYKRSTGKSFRLLFLSDGPGLLHGDTLEESRRLDGMLDGAVRVTTLKLAPSRVTLPWLMGIPE